MENGVTADGFSTFRRHIQSPALQAVADHWNEARTGSRMPSWSDIRPSCIAPYLTRVWSFKYDRATGEFTARLAGNQVTLGFGVSFRGTPLKDIHPPHIFPGVQERLTRLVLGPSVHRACGKLFRVGPFIAEGERIVLPLAADGENADGALGASEYGPVPFECPPGSVEVIHDIEEWYRLDD